MDKIWLLGNGNVHGGVGEDKIPYFCIADGGGWLPGSFASYDAAVAGLAMPYDDLYALQERVNRGEDRLITDEDLAALKGEG